MSHLLIIELPGGNDGDILRHALAAGHEVSFLTANPAQYLDQRDLATLLAQARQIIPAGTFDLERLLPELRALHQGDPFDGVLCLQDLRIVEAAEIAQALGLRHLNSETARLCRDKVAVRRKLAAAGIAQPACARAIGPEDLIAAVAAIGLPVLIKPVDGFGSQNVFALRTEQDLALLREAPEIIAQGAVEYGLGVASRGEMVVERLLEGPLVGCDTVSAGGRHKLLGVNEKLFFPPPSFAIRGGCFTTNCGQFEALEAAVFAMLDAIGFDHGAAHIELILTRDGPMLVEINPRLVGAGIARLISAAREISVHADLIALHAEGRLPSAAEVTRHAATRWIAAPAAGVLASIAVPAVHDPALVGVTLLARPGDTVGPPFDNADRLGCVITQGADRRVLESLAESIVRDTVVWTGVEAGPNRITM
jgi:biotin carboxylase